MDKPPKKMTGKQALILILSIGCMFTSVKGLESFLKHKQRMAELNQNSELIQSNKEITIHNQMVTGSYSFIKNLSNSDFDTIQY